MEELDSRMVRGFKAMDKNLERIADAVGANKNIGSGNDDEDRKRLKERLSEALEIRKRGLLVREIETEDWLEYFLGICKPNGRLGKQGSRCCPDDAFHSRCDEPPKPVPRRMAGSFIRSQDSCKVPAQSGAQSVARSPC